jgi:hypothetical protein
MTPTILPVSSRKRGLIYAQCLPCFQWTYFILPEALGHILRIEIEISLADKVLGRGGAHHFGGGGVCNDEAAVDILHVEAIRQLANHGSVDHVGHGEIAPPLLPVQQHADDESADEPEHQGRKRALLHQTGNDLRRDDHKREEPSERNRNTKAEYVEHGARPDRNDVVPGQADDGGDQDAHDADGCTLTAEIKPIGDGAGGGDEHCRPPAEERGRANKGGAQVNDEAGDGERGRHGDDGAHAHDQAEKQRLYPSRQAPGEIRHKVPGDDQDGDQGKVGEE